MAKTNKQRVLDYLWSVSPNGATNGQIREATGVFPHQQVYLLTQELKQKGLIAAQRTGREWVFYADESVAAQFVSPGVIHPGQRVAASGGNLSPTAFESLACRVMSHHYGLPLAPGTVAGVPKRFDLVSTNGQVVGDAKYFTLVRGQHLPPAKFSVIAEYVWLLEKTTSRHRFLVFGNDPEVPRLWLVRYARLAQGVAFYFLDDDGQLKVLKEE